MKKVSGKCVAMHLLLVLLLSVIVAVVMAIVTGENYVFAFEMWWGIAIVVLLIMYALRVAWGGFSHRSKKTFEKGLEEHHFQDVSTFKTSNAFLAIDGTDGKVGYVANMNPGEFQLAQAKELENIKMDYMKVLGGASAVYFAFTYKGKQTKVYTFLSNKAYAMSSRQVTEGTEKAELYVDILTRAKNA